MKTKMVQTKYGQYVGIESEDGVISFKGIPYGKAPKGNLRWNPPVKVDESDKIVNAFEFGPSCIQIIDENEPNSKHPQDEDCLVLNIWTKEPDVANKPVMVFIHGGAFVGGGTSEASYNGENFVKRNDVLYVSINYRCNILGFMDLEEIGGSEYADSKNLGILDQICALEWVNENISHFGGDSKNITIFGESAGGASVSLLMTSPKAKGLFQKVISQSGTVAWVKDNETARQIGRDFVQVTGKSTMEELLSLSPDEIREASDELFKLYRFKYSIMFCPVADDRLIPKDRFESIRNGCAADVKLLCGTTLDEFNYWKIYYENFEREVGEFVLQHNELIHQANHDELTDVIKTYESESNPEKLLALTNEFYFRLPVKRLAELQAHHNDAWMYLFTWPSSVEGFGSCHAVEMPFVFYNLTSGVPLTGENPPVSLAEKMQATWVAFAKTGNPCHENIPHWPTYDGENRYTMIMDTDWKVESDPNKEVSQVLANFYE